jgi:hypothetical protein
VEIPEVHEAIKGCVDLLNHKWDPKIYCSVSEWRNLMGICEWQYVGSRVREFDEQGQDSDCIKYGMAALWDADQAMRDSISERENPTGFLASPFNWFSGGASRLRPSGAYRTVLMEPYGALPRKC